jgi:putative aldouronate transport system permease protein
LDITASLLLKETLMIFISGKTILDMISSIKKMFTIWKLFSDRVFFIQSSPPGSLMDAAQIDGANEYQTIFLIVLPLIAPTIAAISMFVALNKWNTWFPVLLYTSKEELWTLQYFLRVMVFDKLMASMSNPELGTAPEDIISPVNFQMASIVLVALPIVAIYPFVQKYFVKGIITGAVKG